MGEAWKVSLMARQALSVPPLFCLWYCRRERTTSQLRVINSNIRCISTTTPTNRFFLHYYNAEASLHERQVEDVDTMGDEPHVDTYQIAGEAELEALRDLDLAPAPLPVYDKPSQNTSS